MDPLVWNTEPVSLDLNPGVETHLAMIKSKRKFKLNYSAQSAWTFYRRTSLSFPIPENKPNTVRFLTNVRKLKQSIVVTFYNQNICTLRLDLRHSLIQILKSTNTRGYKLCKNNECSLCTPKIPYKIIWGHWEKSGTSYRRQDLSVTQEKCTFCGSKVQKHYLLRLDEIRLLPAEEAILDIKRPKKFWKTTKATSSNPL